MFSFSPGKSLHWQAAAFTILYSSLIFIVARAVAFSFLLIMVLICFSTRLDRLGFLFTSLLIVFSMAEIFYKFNICKTKPPFTVEEISANTNLADTVSLKLARTLLTRPFWETSANLVKVIDSDPAARFILNKADITLESVKELDGEKINIAQVIELASQIAVKEKDPYIEAYHFTASLILTSEKFKKIIFDKELKGEDILNIFHWAKNSFRREELSFWERPTASYGLGMANIWMGGWTLETEKFTKDITSLVLAQKNYLVGREKEIEQLEEVLVRSKKRNAILLGEPGLGKTTIVYGLALKSFQGEAPEELRYKRFMELDVSSVLASAGEGEVEQRIKDILVETSHAGDVVLYIPVIENLAGALGEKKLDLSGLLSNELENINLQIIGTSNRSSYHEFIERKPVFANKFEIIDISEPSSDEAIRVLEEASIKMEAKHSVVITYQALKTAVLLSERYMVDRVLPGKAIDVLDETAANNALTRKFLVEKTDVERIITTKTKVPANLAEGEEKKKLLELEKVLHERVVGQDEAIVRISEAVRRARTINRNTTRPIGVFLFLGPTGVGKTETAKALAQVYYGSEERIIRLDMSGFNQETSIFRLIGSNPGQTDFREGGQLTEKVRTEPFSLVLLDELEKAHPKVQELFLSIFDEGRIEDSSGRRISFTNTIIIGTSNAGAEFIREEINKKTENDSLRKNLIENLLQNGIFKPEFLNRFDDVIVYKPLDTSQVDQVVILMLKELMSRLSKQDIAIRINPEVIKYLAQKGFDPTFGARPLRRVIQDDLESKISKAILQDKAPRGTKLQANLINGEVDISPLQ